jgi:hypothetical protein
MTGEPAAPSLPDVMTRALLALLALLPTVVASLLLRH